MRWHTDNTEGFTPDELETLNGAQDALEKRFPGIDRQNLSDLLGALWRKGATVRTLCNGVLARMGESGSILPHVMRPDTGTLYFWRPWPNAQEERPVYYIGPYEASDLEPGREILVRDANTGDKIVVFSFTIHERSNKAA